MLLSLLQIFSLSFRIFIVYWDGRGVQVQKKVRAPSSTWCSKWSLAFCKEENTHTSTNEVQVAGRHTVGGVVFGIPSISMTTPVSMTERPGRIIRQEGRRLKKEVIEKMN
jgi:hypothetical protein